MTSINEPPLILHIVFRFDVGGLENGIVNLINRLPPERWRHGIVALDSVSSAFMARVQRKDVFSMQLCKGPGHAVPLYPELFRLCRRLRPTIVHTRNLAALEACVPAWAAGVPVRIHGEHGRDLDDLDGSNRKNQLVRRCYRPFVHHYVTMSQDLQRYLGSRVGVPSQRISQIYNGVDTKLFGLCGKTRPRIRGCPFVDQDFWVVGTVGRMQGVKAQTVLAAAFAMAIKRDPGAASRLRLVMVGDGPLLGEVERILVDGGVRHLAWLPGERTDIPQILGALDCFVLPSLAEGISNTLLEASASGLPVVATQVGGNPEIVEDGVTGHLVAAGSPSALTDAMLRYLHAPETARQHGLAGRRVVEQRFSLERMMRDYDNLYRDLLDRHVRTKRTSVRSADRSGRQDHA